MRSAKALFGAWMLMLFVGFASASAAHADELAGTWQLEIASPQGTRTPTMTLTQAGTQVTGTYKSQRGEVPVNGTVQNGDFALTIKVATQDEQLVLEYKGRVDGDSMNGRVIMGARGEVTFTGKRAPKT
ncbi:MAG: hypothetical protein ABW136_09440 [Steroidobacteraceae bacterium]